MVVKLLRLCSILLILICIFIPAFKLPILTNSWVLVLVDTSKSMSIGAKREQTKAILSQIKFRKKIYGFDTSPYLLLKDTLITQGNETNIANALNLSPKPSVYLLISDGINNNGPDPIKSAESQSIPIYCIKVGEAAKDIYISRTNYNGVIYEGTPVIIKSYIENSGFSKGTAGISAEMPKKIKVSLYEKFAPDGKENKQLLQEKNLPLVFGGITEIEFNLNFVSPGNHRYELNISELPGELTYENNKKELGIQVIKSRIKLCWLSEAPSWNFRFAKQELTQDSSIDFDWYIKIGAGKWLSSTSGGNDGLKSNVEISSDYDVIIVEDFNEPEIEKAINTASGVIIIGAFNSNRLQNISPLLIQPGKDKNLQESKSPVETDEIGLFGEKLLPPLKELYPVSMVKSGATIICRTTGTDGNKPIIAKWKYRHTEVINIAAKDIWRWNLYGGIKFWDKLVKLTAGHKPGLWVDNKTIYELGERIIFNAQAYNENYLPYENCKIVVKIQPTASDSDIIAPFYSTGQGRYEGSVEFLPPGEYKYKVISNNFPKDSIKGNFSITGDFEMKNLTPDEGFLRILAEVSGGKYIENIKELSTITEGIKPHTSWSTISLHPANYWGMLVLIISLLSIEWFIIRRK